MAKFDAKPFLDNFSKNLLAANVTVPDMETQFNKRVDYPELPETFPKGNYPFDLEGKEAKYKAVGSFGQFKDEKEAEMYKKAGMSSPIERSPIRGFMDYIPGGIPASEGFDYDKSLEKFPEQMKGIQRGNMPVFRTF